MLESGVAFPYSCMSSPLILHLNTMKYCQNTNDTFWEERPRELIGREGVHDSLPCREVAHVLLDVREGSCALEEWSGT